MELREKLCAICVQLLLDFLSVRKGEGVGETTADPLAGLNARDQSVRPHVRPSSFAVVFLLNFS